MSELAALAERLGVVLRNAGLRLVTAESCTGGGIAESVTALPGSSAWFDRGVVAYSNEAKRDMLGVSARLIEAHGAVSEPVVAAMAAGIGAGRADRAAVAVSGIAGPGGGSAAKPVGNSVHRAGDWRGLTTDQGPCGSTALAARSGVRPHARRSPTSSTRSSRGRCRSPSQRS